MRKWNEYQIDEPVVIAPGDPWEMAGWVERVEHGYVYVRTYGKYEPRTGALHACRAFQIATRTGHPGDKSAAPTGQPLDVFKQLCLDAYKASSQTNKQMVEAYEILRDYVRGLDADDPARETFVACRDALREALTYRGAFL